MNDARWMKSALVLARRAVGRTWPNPAVGCILVRDGRIVGRGVTAPGGRPHAEPTALTQAGPLAAGATAYVTLEPCAHHGKTPPCTDALIAAGIARAVVAIEDPDPRVSGRGITALKNAGIAVRLGIEAEAARAVNAGFLSRIERGRPHILLKLAASLDGRIATRTGESRWITGSAARRYVHAIRARSDAVLIGAGTARADDPMLDVRGLGLGARKPVRVVADGSLSIPLTGRLVQTARDRPLWVLHRPDAPPDRADALRNAGAILLPVPAPDGLLDMSAALTDLAERGLTNILCEGGGRIAASLLARGLVDKLAVFSAGKIIGGDGTPAVQPFGLETLLQAPEFSLIRSQTVGTDTVAWWVKER